MKSKACDKCIKEISLSNFNRHVSSCKGIITKQIIWSCAHCQKEFDNAQGWSGHVVRSHTHKHLQQIAGVAGNVVKKKLGISNKGKSIHSVKYKEKQSLLMIERLKIKPFWSKRETYNGVTLDSSYEGIVARSLDENGIVWERPNKAFRYFDGKQYRHYLPDFYLPKYKIYLDPKNDYLISRDKKKIDLTIKQNNIRVLVLDKNSLTWNKIAPLV